MRDEITPHLRRFCSLGVASSVPGSRGFAGPGMA